jgi:hypothetical protein
LMPSGRRDSQNTRRPGYSLRKCPPCSSSRMRAGARVASRLISATSWRSALACRSSLWSRLTPAVLTDALASRPRTLGNLLRDLGPVAHRQREFLLLAPRTLVRDIGAPPPFESVIEFVWMKGAASRAKRLAAFPSVASAFCRSIWL